MKIAILSDFHFGFGSGSERESDPYDAFQEAMEKTRDCDLFIFAGDIFDNRTPNAETFVKAMELMLPLLLRKSEVKLLEGINKDVSKLSPITLMGTPIVAIHGTHERRTKGLLNPVEALEKAGFLIYLHLSGVIFEKDGIKIAIQGMSSVPDQYAENELEEWKPSPIPNCFNILVLHQSITEFLYAPHTLDMKKIPKGFDLYINGHIHEAKKTFYDGKFFLLSGSLIHTQVKEESEKAKGFWVVDVSDNKVSIEWRVLEKQRRIYLFCFENPRTEEVEKVLTRINEEHHEKKPIVRIEFKGEVNEKLIREIEMKFSDKFLLSLKKEKEEIKIASTSIQEHKMSVDEMGKKLMRDNLEKMGMKPELFEHLFELLSEDENEKAIESLLDYYRHSSETKEIKERKSVKQAKLFEK